MSSVSPAEALATVILTTITTDVAPSQMDSTAVPKPFTSRDGIERTFTGTIYRVDTVNVTSVSAIDTDGPDAGRYIADKARTADPLSHNAWIAGKDPHDPLRNRGCLHWHCNIDRRRLNIGTDAQAKAAWSGTAASSIEQPSAFSACRISVDPVDPKSCRAGRA